MAWQTVRALSDYFFGLVLERLGPMAADRDRAVAPGQIYLIDHTRNTNNYVALRLRTGNGKDAPITTARLRPQLGALELQLLGDVDAATALCARVRAQRPEAVVRGKFRSIIRVTRTTDLHALADEIRAEAERIANDVAGDSPQSGA